MLKGKCMAFIEKVTVSRRGANIAGKQGILLPEQKVQCRRKLVVCDSRINNFLCNTKL